MHRACPLDPFASLVFYSKELNVYGAAVHCADPKFHSLSLLHKYTHVNRPLPDTAKRTMRATFHYE